MFTSKISSGTDFCRMIAFQIIACGGGGGVQYFVEWGEASVSNELTKLMIDAHFALSAWWMLIFPIVSPKIISIWSGVWISWLKFSGGGGGGGVFFLQRRYR